MAALGLSVLSTGGLIALFATGKSAGASGATSTASIVRTGAAASAAESASSPATAAAQSTQTAPATTATSSSQSAPATAATTTQSAPATTAPTTAPAAAAASPTVVDGADYSNRWGDVQIEATFDANGALVNVIALQTPHDRSRSIEINNYAVPQLTSEALAAQSASIDSISGATYTSNDYIRSLQSAIDAARAAGVTSIA